MKRNQSLGNPSKRLILSFGWARIKL